MRRPQLAALALLAGIMACTRGDVVVEHPDDAEEISLDVQFSHPAGLFGDSFELEITTGMTGAVIRYTLDGDPPDDDAIGYDGPIPVVESTRVRAQAFQGETSGPLASRAFLKLGDDMTGFSTNLPLVVLDSFGYDIDAESGSEEYRPEWPRRPCEAVFVEGSDETRATVDGPNDFVGRVGVKVRGNSSQVLPKKQYSVELWDENDDDLDAPILGMPAESDWAFHAPYGDKSLMRTYLAYQWGNDLGYRASRARLVEVFFNQDDGEVTRDDYVGVHLVLERHKRGPDRVDVSALDETATAEPEITGGYILKVDVADENEEPFETAEGNPPIFPWIGFLHVYPKEADITDAQHDWILGYLDDFEAALYGDDFADPTTGYAAFVDVDSFVHYQLLTEALKNADSYYASEYMHKDREGPLRMGPIWDWNVSFGGTSDWDVFEPDGWLYRHVDAFWFSRLVDDPAYCQRWHHRWTDVRADTLATDRLLADITETAAYLDEAQARNFERWPILGEYIDDLPHLNYPGWDERTTHADEVAYLEQWLVARLEWIDENAEDLGGGP